MNLCDGSPGQVVDCDLVRSTKGGQVEFFDVVHGLIDGGDVPDEHGARKIRRQAHRFANVGSMELQRVRTSPSIDYVTGVARVPEKRIRVVTERHDVVALPAADNVTSWA